MNRPGEASAERTAWAWSQLVPDQDVIVVKQSPDGAEAARYAGVVVATFAPGTWIVVQANWTYRPVSIDGLTFQPGDILLEWFSPDHHFNAFAVFSPGNLFRGWYANVSMPAELHAGAPADRPVLVWRDLYLDLIGLPDGESAWQDEDELEASPLRASDPELYRNVWANGHELMRRFSRNLAPFLPEAELAAMVRLPKQIKARR